ncbi:PID-CTERM protein-sorting domain-containing protein [Schleiferia thermophila]|uniref:PID-CTERM protein-sorting domain-containing protein n=1 Tax=Schleiferia thermophila TaxID=884107 RepID=UPI003EEB7F64
MKKSLNLLIILLSFPLFIYAQPNPPNGPVPIDGAIGLLLAAGAAAGYLKSKRKN